MEPVNKKTMSELVPGDIVAFKNGGEAKILKRGKEPSFNFPHVFYFEYGNKPYTYTDEGHFLLNEEHLLDIVGIEKGIQPLSGEIFCVISLQRTGPNLTFLTNLKKVRSIARSGLLSKIVAVFNPFETGGKWTEGMGLELLKEVEE